MTELSDYKRIVEAPQRAAWQQERREWAAMVSHAKLVGFAQGLCAGAVALVAAFALVVHVAGLHITFH